MNNFLKNEDGYTLVEVLIVLVIISILTLIAVPIYQNITTQAKMTEAQNMLKQLHTLEQSYKLQHDVYSGDLQRLGFQQVPLVTNGGNARYAITIQSASDTSYVARATSVVDFDDDGVMNVWSVNNRGEIVQVIPD